MSDTPKCELCDEPMPEGEEMFKYHGYSGPCPKPPLPRKPTEIERLTAELNQARAELQNARNDNDGLLLTVQELRYNISHAYTLPDGDFLSVEELGQKFTTNESKLASLTQELEQLRAGYALTLAQLEDAIMVANDLAADHAKETVKARSEYWKKALSSTPQSVKDVMDVMEAAKEHAANLEDLISAHPDLSETLFTPSNNDLLKAVRKWEGK